MQNQYLGTRVSTQHRRGRRWTFLHVVVLHQDLRPLYNLAHPLKLSLHREHRSPLIGHTDLTSLVFSEEVQATAYLRITRPHIRPTAPRHRLPQTMGRCLLACISLRRLHELVWLRPLSRPCIALGSTAGSLQGAARMRTKAFECIAWVLRVCFKSTRMSTKHPYILWI